MKAILFQLSLLCFVLFSCSSKKDVLYLQDSKKSNFLSSKNFEYKIQKGDILNIRILTQNPENLLSLNQSTNFDNYNNLTREALIFKGYVVDNDGFIQFPEIGDLIVNDLTVSQLKKLISKRLTAQEILNNAIIDVKVLNMYFTILGEVEKPGKYFFDEENINLFQALGMSGDLTINGNRKNIKLIRKIDNKMTINEIDLTNTKFITGDNFQILPGDTILVDPNTSRVKNAGIIGNSGTLLSLLSFLLSSIIIINN